MIKWSAMLAMMILAACGEELNSPEVVIPSHRVIKVSQSANGNIINAGGAIDFADVSQGVVAREWTFSNEDHIVIEGDVTEEQLKVTFNQVGDYEVNLHQEFKSDAYSGKGTTPIGQSLDTAFSVTVMPKVEVIEMKANLLDATGTVGREIDLNPDVPTDIPFGSVIRYTYVAEGSPTQISGDLNGAELVDEDPANSTFDVKYIELEKVYSMSPIFTRPMPQSSDTLVFTDFVKCVRSSDPVTLTELASQENFVSIEFSRGLDPTSIKSEEFSIAVTTAGGGTLMPVFDAAISPSNASVVLLTMTSEQFYSDDQVTVTYSGTSLETADKAKVSSFADEESMVIEVNILEESGYDYSFESSGITWVAGTTAWLGGDFTNTLEKTTLRATEGATSLKVSVDPYSGTAPWGNGTIVEPSENGSLQTFPYSSEGDNKVKIAFDLFLEDNGGGIEPSVPNQFATNMRMYINWGCGGAEKAHSLGGAVTGSWQELTDVVTISDPQNAPFSMAMKIAQTGEEVFTVYVDNIRITKWNPRP
ncbi:hypothetical protein BGP76_00035 [Reichenbachiella sp. MSK19-1]|nr:hypothetical protein BGP76_00035 [Reichenbachiella sp. MSK19-1]